MVQRFVWWDEVEKREVVRREVRIPKPLDDFCREVSKVHGVSFNAFIVGVLVYAADSQTRQRLRLEVVPSVRVTEAKPVEATETIPVQAASPAYLKRYRIPKDR